MDRVDAAVAAVPEKFYVLEPDGRPLPQTSNPQVIADVLRLADVPAGARVLEVGTGSGYSTALLSHLVGASGSVVSLEVDAAVADRARRLLLEQGIGNVVVLAADGQRGCLTHAPFDGIISWATADVISPEWCSQLCSEGWIVAPVSLGPLPHTTAVVRLRRDGEGTIWGERVIPGSFVPLTALPQSAFGRAPANADVVVEPESDPATWVSSKWLKGASSEVDRAEMRDRCLALTVALGSGILTAQESVEAFRAYLLAALPDELTTAFLRSTGRAIGCSTAQGIALLSLRDGTLYTAGSTMLRRLLEDWAEEWRCLGCPGYDQLEPTAKCGPNGWIVRINLGSSQSA